MDPMAEPFFTIGHSTRSLDELVALLAPNEVRVLVDVRTVPRSRTNPQYNTDTLPAALSARGLEYRHLAALGGLRGRRKDIPVEVNGYWENASFHKYADYAMGEEFRAGLASLVALGRERRCAIMCAESVWWRCHRRIITDYLLASGEEVFHIVSSDVPEPARLTPGAEPGPKGALVYPGEQRSLF
jgi:uncharacterized protein (DUF488 family)